MPTLPGSCLCGRVRFDIEGAFDHFFLCHCRHCQKDTGSAHAANLFSSTATLRWQSGQDLVQEYQLPATLHKRAFCRECGSAMPNLQMEGRLLVVPAGSLDGDPEIRPTAHIFVDSRASWDHELESVPTKRGSP